MNLFEYVATNSQIERLLLFRTIGPNHDRRLVRDGLPAPTNHAKGIAIRCNIRAFEVGFREDINAGGKSLVRV